MIVSTDTLKAWGYREVQVIKPFKSKKNCVFLAVFTDERGAQEQLVVKKFSGPEGIRETRILRHLSEQDVQVPKVIHADDSCVVLEYIQGVTFLEWFEATEERATDGIVQPEAVKMIEDLAQWMQSVYCAFETFAEGPLILGDVNYRNFILGSSLYGIDFEDCKQGSIATDAGMICAFALTYRPEYTPWKLRFVDIAKQILSNNLGIPAQTIDEAMQVGIEELRQNRARK